MSSVYATEPATAGRVILETTDGPLEIHLWCRECPQTTRFFLQLCLDGFYDDMVFHRIVNNFLIQTGALRHASAGSVPSMNSPEGEKYRQETQASHALDRRPYETNSRIRFNHRGQVAMALGVDDTDDVEDLQPQFFITLEDAPYLDGKHVVFGTLNGPTIFNAVRIGRIETDESTHQPVDLPNATRIKSVKIVENPIHQGLTPHPNPPWRIVKQPKADELKPQKKKKRKGKYDTNVLSFGAEFDEEDAMPIKAKKGMQSSHDVVKSKVLSKEVDEEVKDVVIRKDEESDHSNSDESREKRLPKKTRTDAAPESNNGPHYTKDRQKDENNSSSEKIHQEDKEKPPNESSSGKPAAKPSLVEARRLKYTKGKKSKKEREEETLNKLMAFRSTVKQKVEERKSSSSTSSDRAELPQDDSPASRMARRAEKGNDRDDDDVEVEKAPTYHGQVLDSDDEDNNGEEGVDGKNKWLATAFKCKRHVDHDSQGLGGDGRAADDYEVIDSKKVGRGRHRHSHKERSKHQKSTKRKHGD